MLDAIIDYVLGAARVGRDLKYCSVLLWLYAQRPYVHIRTFYMKDPEAELRCLRTNWEYCKYFKFPHTQILDLAGAVHRNRNLQYLMRVGKIKGLQKKILRATTTTLL